MDPYKKINNLISYTHLSFAKNYEKNQSGGLTEILAAFVNDRIVNESPTKSSRMVLPVNQANM